MASVAALHRGARPAGAGTRRRPRRSRRASSRPIAATNSIIITAPDAIYNNLRAVVEKLDVRRAQVYVEALIVEVTADKAAEFGIQWQSLSGARQVRHAGLRRHQLRQRPGQNITRHRRRTRPPPARGLNVGVVNGTITIPGVGVEVLNLGLLVRALETDANANILSTPTLLTLDNEEAKIVDRPERARSSPASTRVPARPPRRRRSRRSSARTSASRCGSSRRSPRAARCGCRSTRKSPASQDSTNASPA